MDGELNYSLEKMKIKKEKACFIADNCLVDTCDQTDIKEGLIKSKYDLTDDGN